MTHKTFNCVFSEILIFCIDFNCFGKLIKCVLFHKYEKEARITVDLIDDIFVFFVVLPGILVETNADSILNDTLLWRFSGVKFADNDFKLIAKSTIYHKSRYHWTMIIIMLIITFTTIYWISSKVPDPMKMSK